MLLAGIDGIQNKIHPGDPGDKDLYDLEPEEDKKIPTVCHSLDMALDYLDKDRGFLGGRGMSSAGNDFIDAYIEVKMKEVTRLRMTTHPIEVEMYLQPVKSVLGASLKVTAVTPPSPGFVAGRR